MNVTAAYFNQSMPKKISIVVIFFILQCQFQYFVFLCSMTKQYDVITQLQREKRQALSRLDREMDKIRNEITKIGISNEATRQFKKENAEFRLTKVINHSSLVVHKMEIKRSPGMTLSVSAQGSFLEFYRLLQTCHVEHVLMENFYLQKNIEQDTLYIFIKMVAL
jgi:hypothetical protein